MSNPDKRFSEDLLAIEWYLMARENNFAPSHVNHIEWTDVFLMIYFLTEQGKSRRGAS